MSPELLQSYLDLGTAVPQSIIDSAVLADDEREIQALSRSFFGNRKGYTNNDSTPDVAGTPCVPETLKTSRCKRHVDNA
jgi:hypothetical protein